MLLQKVASKTTTKKVYIKRNLFSFFNTQNIYKIMNNQIKWLRSQNRFLTVFVSRSTFWTAVTHNCSTVWDMKFFFGIIFIQQVYIQLVKNYSKVFSNGTKLHKCNK